MNTTKCIHRWRLAEARGGARVVDGVCRYCGARRSFKVSLDWFQP